MPGIKCWGNHEGPVLDSVKGFDVIDCNSCGFKHIVPIPSQDELAGVYRDEYYAKEKPLYIDRYKEDLEWWNLVYSERYEAFEKNLSEDRRRILDVGSGPGYFLLHGKQRGWKTKGIEPSHQAAEHSKGLGLDILEDFFDNEMAKTIGQFDVVHLSEVLEHIPDPACLLKLVKNVLTPDGLVCVVVPNDYNPFQYALRTVCDYGPWWVAPPHHINYFNFDSLARLLKSSGFEIILKESTFPIDMFLLMGDNYIGNDELGRQCHAKRKLLEKNLASAGLNHLKREICEKFSESGIGREAMIYGIKKNA
jgi:SAM-dependent methyltransferase